MQIKEIENPISSMQFQGLHWIEASAGTGKTFTLSSLMVRILLEKYLPRQVIATTFTRKAAAELKSRIRQRLYSMLQLLDSLRTELPSDIEARAKTEKDELVQVVLTRNPAQIGYACERLQLVLDQLDELFVGTLDSFSQTLLREFAFESGKIERADITSDDKQYVQQLVHDILREWVQEQPQDAVTSLLQHKKLKSVAGYADVMEKSLNFSSAKLNAVTAPEFSLSAIQQAVEVLAQQPLDDFSAFENFTPNGAYAKLINQPWSKTSIVEVLRKLPESLEQIQQQGVQILVNGQLPEALQQLQAFIKKSEPRSASGKKKIDDADVNTLQHHPVFSAVQNVLAAVQQASEDLEALDRYLQYHIAIEVKNRLPQMLQSKGETTFSQQIRTLSEALQGEQGNQFATFVHARYPLILVDEFQDTNLDQDTMLAEIWRHPSRLKQGCMIMVGDRKQAIYGFRGGDMLTFIKARDDVYRKQGSFYQLKKNFRSIAPLVEAVDALFQQQMDFGEDVLYVPITAGAEHADLHDQEQINPVPLRWLQLEHKDQEAEQVAWKIQHLLQQSAQGQLYLTEPDASDAEKQPLMDSDIAVLSSGHSALNAVQQALLSLGIRVNRAAKRSVFSSAIAQDVGAVLAAVLSPYQEAKVKRALLGRLLGLKLNDLWRADSQTFDLSHYIAQFDHIRELWLNQGFLPAWHYCLNYFKIWERIVALHSRENERDVVNLRHLTEILSDQSEQLQGAQHLFHWYLKQLKAPKSHEWELERPLTNAEGVKLMTIHQSKGLEFKVVFLLNADGGPKADNTLIFSYENVQQDEHSEKRRVIDIGGTSDELKKQQHDERRYAEQHRLWYVALTRASHRIYAVLRTQDHKSLYSLPFWAGQGEFSFQHPQCAVERLITEPSAAIHTLAQAELVLDALPLPEARFYPRSNTSFTGLSQHLAYRQLPQDQLAIQTVAEDSADDETDQVAEAELPADEIDWIKQQFPKGTVAGTFLHSIYEQIDFQGAAGWKLEVLRRFKNDGPQLLIELRLKMQESFAVWKTFAQAWKSSYIQAVQPLHHQAQQLFGAQLVSHEQHKLLRSAFMDFNHMLMQALSADVQSSSQWASIFQSTVRYQPDQLLTLLRQLSTGFQAADSTEIRDCLQQAVTAINAQQAKLQPKDAPAYEAKNIDAYVDMGFGALVESMQNEMLYALMTQWMQDVVQAPLHGPFSLSCMPLNSHLPEFPFHLALHDQPVQIRKIQQLFKEHRIQIEALNEANSARYLVGAVDLVYFDGERYHIADYKSNFLGKTEQHYALDEVKNSMSQSSYWLQAALYLVALHRYLKVNLQSYNINQHLGGASYLYLRGMSSQSNSGTCHWQPDAEFILQLDRILGYAHADKYDETA
ncbi:UvrD-helicase domain-containing protein [Acinetobacter sp. ANC 3813]|uniref:UvrD-helicase domain-containing protein n=1 Tax=Acinetobacter sp. ANC 3813 TaxID=1977873 RepID=UPI000A32C179|nr:UvrD-helicase domain-containing protein [Acinetobacter sp. ANC 3813]OTG87293.1 exodeoxyribonuclease V subunit beta [Acinetobacter sp. ANC 3813]